MRDPSVHPKPTAAMSSPSVRAGHGGGRALALVAVGIAAGLCSSCKNEEHHYTPSQNSAAMTVSTIPPSPVSGTIAGRRFGTHDAWYRVTRKAGRERIDVILSEGRITRLCAESEPEYSRAVWVRFPRWQRFTPGEYRVDPDTAANAPVSVHYEATGEENRWDGNDNASAVVAIDAQQGDVVTGRMKACFGDEHRSCVEGAFRAIECRPETDPDSPTAGNYLRRESMPRDGGARP